MPGVIIPTDLAPTQVGVSDRAARDRAAHRVTARRAATAANRVPELFAVVAAVRRPGRGVVHDRGARASAATKGTGQRDPRRHRVTTDHLVRHARSLSPCRHRAVARAGPAPAHASRRPTASTTVNGLTFHVGIGGAATTRQSTRSGPTSKPNYSAAKVQRRSLVHPAETLPATANHAIQNALERGSGAATSSSSTRQATPTRGEPARRLLREPDHRLAGQAPGRRPRRLPTAARSSRARSSTAAPSAATAQLATDWYTKIGALTWDGNQTVNDGAVIYVCLADATTAADAPASSQRLHAPRIDGFDIRGGDQQGFPGNINDLTGGADRAARRTSSPRAARSSPTPTPATCRSRTTWSRTTAAATARSGSARPTCRRPTPTSTTRTSGSPTTGSSHNAGTNLAGGIGLFAGCGRLRGRRQRHLRQLLAGVRRRRQRLRPQPRTARSTTTASTSTTPTTRAAAS